MTLTRRSRATSLATGVLLMLLAAMGVAVGVQPVYGQEDGLGGGDGDDGVGNEEAPPADEVETQDIEVTETAVYAHPVTDALPPTLTESVPPQAVCIVAPDLCPEELRPVTDGIGGAIGTGQDEAPSTPLAPVDEDSIAVSYFAGHEHYESALKFELPEVPEDHEVTSFKLYLPVTQPTGDFSSPAFRDIVTSIFLTISDQDPAAFVERFVEAVQSEPVQADNDFLRMEACALTKPFEPSDQPQTQDAEEDMPRDEPRQEGETGPRAVDCLLGGTGVRDEEGEHWVFDLTFAVDAWASGESENHGLLIRPAGVPNLAFGDPDSTTFAQIALDVGGASAETETAEPPPPLDGLGEAGTQESGGGPDQATSGGDFEEAPAPGGAPSSDGQDLESPQVADEPEMGDEPARSEPVDEPVAADSGTQQATPAGSAAPSPWTWLLVPVFAGGAWLVTRALTAPVAAAAAGGGNAGAMSRLIESRGGPSPA